MGDEPAPAKADGKADADARRAEQAAADSAAPQPPEDGKPFPSPAKNTTPPEEELPEPEIEPRHAEPTD